MPYQSTRNRYRSKAEKNRETARKAKLLFWFGLLIAAILVLKDWRDHWGYLKTYFME